MCARNMPMVQNFIPLGGGIYVEIILYYEVENVKFKVIVVILYIGPPLCHQSYEIKLGEWGTLLYEPNPSHILNHVNPFHKVDFFPI
jgi:hypothetical protein